MPLPKPQKDESQEAYINRCMGNAIMLAEYPDDDQRMAICLSQFEGNIQANQFTCNEYSHNDSVAKDEVPWQDVEKGKLPDEAFVLADVKKYAHHWIQNDKLYLHKTGLNNAWNLARALRADDTIIQHLAGHRKAMGLDANEDRSENMQEIAFSINMSELCRYEQFRGREHLVVPVCLIAQGVLNGLYYPDWALNDMPQVWNGIPVPVFHPKKNGVDVSCNDPEVIEKYCVGTVFNCHYDETTKKLMGEVWIDIETCKEVSPTVLEMLEKDEMVEVSTGLWHDINPEAGFYNNKEYKGIAYNYRPDHLALLPGATGACSVDDGGGMPRVNSSEAGEQSISVKLLLKAVKGMQALGRKLGVDISTNELSHSDIWSALYNAINEQLDVKDAYIREAYDDYFIYTVYPAEGVEEKSFKLTYAIEGDEVQIGADPIEVKLVTDWVAVNEEENKGDQKMERKESIDALIANSNWTEDDREFLTNMTDEQFEKVAPAVDDEGAQKVEDETPPIDNKDEETETPVDNQEKPPVSLDEFVNNAPDSEMKETLRRALNRDKQIKADLVASLKANKRNKFTEENLNTKSIDELNALCELGNIEVNRIGEPSVDELGVNEDEPPAPVGYDWSSHKFAKNKKEESK